MAGYPYRNICSTHDRPEWLAARRNYIGASDVPTILGMKHGSWSSRVALFESKVSLEEPSDEWNEHAYWGLRHEPTLREEFTERTGLRCRAVNKLVASRRFPWLAVTADADYWNELGDRGPLELKCTSTYESAWREGEVPDYVMAQVQTQMIVRCGLGRGLGAVAVLFMGNEFHHRYDIRPIPDLQEQIIQESKAFFDMVAEGQVPAVDPSDACRKALSRLYPTGTPGKVVQLAGSAWTQRDEELAEIDRGIKDAEERRQEIRNAIAAEIGEAEVGQLDNGVRWIYGTTKRGRTLRREKN